MPKVILSYPRVPHPDTNDLLHGEGRRDWNTELNVLGYKKEEVFICRLRKCNDKHYKNQVRKIPPNILYCSGQKSSFKCLSGTCDCLKLNFLTYQRFYITFRAQAYLIHSFVIFVSHSPDFLQFESCHCSSVFYFQFYWPGFKIKSQDWDKLLP